MRSKLLPLLLLLAGLAFGQTKADLDESYRVLRNHVAYREAPNSKHVRPPLDVACSGYGNCLEQSLALCYFVLYQWPSADCYIVGYDNGPGTVGHAVALINGAEYNTTRAPTDIYTRRFIYTYEAALALYTRPR